MKKSTILIIVAIFLISVFVVGVFGLKDVPYNEIVYIEKIVPTSVILSTGAESPQIKTSQKGYYYIVVPYEQNIKVMINYDIVPNDATNRKLDIEVTNINANSKGSILESGAILLEDKGVVKVTYRALDSASGAKMEFYIYTR